MLIPTQDYIVKDIEKLNDKQRRWVDEVIPDLHNNSYKKQYIKAMTTNSLRTAINSKCLDCCYWQTAEVRKCPVEDCLLMLTWLTVLAQ